MNEEKKYVHYYLSAQEKKNGTGHSAIGLGCKGRTKNGLEPTHRGVAHCTGRH
jgi:hypothetical protein